MGGAVEYGVVYGLLYYPGKGLGDNRILLQNTSPSGSLENWGCLSEICNYKSPAEVIREKFDMATGLNLKGWQELGRRRHCPIEEGFMCETVLVYAAILDKDSIKYIGDSLERLENSLGFRFETLPNIIHGKNISPDARYISRHFGVRLRDN
ncbi:MAG: hypothetical protein ACP5E4_01950 [Candidatus Aenigmatarchaeota archaeon]